MQYIRCNICWQFCIKNLCNLHIDLFVKIAYNNSARRGRFGAIFVIAKPMTSNVRLGEC